MDAPPFTGVGVALVTLFDQQGRLDAGATASLAAELCGRGVRAVVVAGTTGEAPRLEREERVELLRAVRTAVVPGVPVIAGTGAPTPDAAATFTCDARDHGADAVLVLSPPGVDDVRPYYDTVADAAGDVPVLAYHFPRVSAPGIPIEVLADLPVVGCKDSSGDADRLLALVTAYDGACYTGSSALLSFAGPLGCTGAILALANVEPELCRRAFEGDAGAQRELAPAHLASREPFPGALKEMAAARFGVSAVARAG